MSEIDDLRRYVSEFYVRKDVLAERLGRMEDKIDVVAKDVKDLQTDTKSRSATWKGAIIAIIVGLSVGVLVPLLLKSIGGG